jgi:tetratricopeptide (TPR) repeat protein
MKLAELDKTGTVYRLAAEGEVALGEGDTARARERFGQAGKSLEETVGNMRKQADKHLARFLAATHHYKGGHYARALELSQRVQRDLLPEPYRELYRTFEKEVRKRARESYAREVRGTLFRHLQSGEYAQILVVLQDHPYVLPRAKMAYLRAFCSEHLGDYRAAATFFADTIRFDPSDLALISLAAAYPFQLREEGRLREAEDYLGHQLRLLPHPVTSSNASLLSFYQFLEAGTPEERQRRLDQQVAHCQTAWEAFQGLPPEQLSKAEYRELMALCFEATALALNRQGHAERARQFCDTAIGFAPGSATLRSMRALVTYPAPQAVKDFEDAIRLGERSSLPHYFLAHDALLGNDYVRLERHCSQALALATDPRLRAQLLEWLAIGRAEAGQDLDAARALFQEALRFDPSSRRIRHNAAVFEARSRSDGVVVPSAWDRETDLADQLGRELVIQQSHGFLARSQPQRGLEQELNPTAA